jgi:hypothetical protein
MNVHAFGRNKRRYRIILPCQAWLQDHPSPQVFSGWTCNLGEGGACLELSFDQTDGFFPGSLLFLNLDPKGDQLPLEARVVWVGPPSPPVGTQHGVAFPRLTPDQRLCLQALGKRQSWSSYGSVAHGSGQSPGSRTGEFRVLFSGDLKPGARPEDAKDRLTRLFQVDYGTLEDLFQGGAGGCVVKQGLDRAMAERYVAALDAAGALCRVEADPSRKLANVSLADVHPIADDGLRDESGPRRSAPRRVRTVRSFVIGATIGLLLLGGGLGLLWGWGTLRMPGFETSKPSTQSEKLPPAMERPRPKAPAKGSRTGATRSPAQ